MFETLRNMKSDQQLFADLVCFDLIYHSEKKRENHVHQGLSKVFAFYSSNELSVSLSVLFSETPNSEGGGLKPLQPPSNVVPVWA